MNEENGAQVDFSLSLYACLSHVQYGAWKLFNKALTCVKTWDTIMFIIKKLIWFN